jgi:hypothetical protein
MKQALKKECQICTEFTGSGHSLVNTAINLEVPHTAGNLSTSSVIISFPSTTLVHAVIYLVKEKVPHSLILAYKILLSIFTPNCQTAFKIRGN